MLASSIAVACLLGDFPKVLAKSERIYPIVHVLKQISTKMG